MFPKTTLKKALPGINRVLHEESSIYTFLPAGELRDKTLDNALKHVAPKCAKKNVVALWDTTLFKSGKDGFLLAQDGLYSNYFERFGGTAPKIAFEGLIRLEIKSDQSDYVIAGYEDGSSETVYCSIYTKAVMRLLKQLSDFCATPEGPQEEKPPKKSGKKAVKPAAKPVEPVKKAEQTPSVKPEPAPKKKAPAVGDTLFEKQEAMCAAVRQALAEGSDPVAAVARVADYYAKKEQAAARPVNKPASPTANKSKDLQTIVSEAADQMAQERAQEAEARRKGEQQALDRVAAMRPAPAKAPAAAPADEEDAYYKAMEAAWAQQKEEESAQAKKAAEMEKRRKNAVPANTASGLSSTQQDILQRAKAGDPEMQRYLANAFSSGTNGFPRNREKAAYWKKLADESKGRSAATSDPYHIWTAKEREQHIALALCGMEEDLQLLAEGYTYGRYGLPKDKTEALHWTKILVRDHGDITAFFALTEEYPEITIADL